MYNQRTPKDFNIQKLVDSDMLLQFLREQPMWQKLITQSFADEQDALNIVIETINTKINRGESFAVTVEEWLHAARPTHPVGSFQTEDDP